MGEMTDSELSPVSKKQVTYNSLETVFGVDYEIIMASISNADVDDPILILDWNQTWVGNNVQTKQAVIQFLRTNGATDRNHSDFIFHFQSFDDLIRCQEAMRVAIPIAFHDPLGVVDRINTRYNLQIPVPVPMARVWVVIKTAVLSTDYNELRSFFSNI